MSVAFHAFQFTTPPSARNRSENAVPDCHRYAPSFASGTNQVFTCAVVKVPVVGVVAPTVPFIFIEAVPVKFVTVPELGVHNAPQFISTFTPSTASCHALARERVVSDA